MNLKKKRQISLYYTILIFSTITTMGPFLWLIMSSLKTTNEIFASPFGLPEKLLFSNFLVAWNKANIGVNFVNSIIICFSAVFVLLLISSMASYVIARIWKSFGIYAYFALGISIPIHTIVIPIFITTTKIGLYNTRLGLILIYIVSNLPLAIFILTGFMKGFSREIEEAAWIDGSSLSRTFFTMVLPLSKNGLATVGILGFMYSWNDFFMANVLISKTALKTITQGIQQLQGSFFTDYGPLFAGMIIAIIPVVVVYIIFQEQIIEGMTAGAVKG